MEELVTNIQGYSIHDGPGIRTLVFFKGCALECQWCANPECISLRREVGFIKTLCTGCGKCDGVCPENALDFGEDRMPQIARKKCTACGACVSACAYNALVIYGKPMSVEEIFDAVKRDSMFHQASGGGVTVSGGEPLLRPKFIRALFEKCRQAGIDTCIETCGAVPASAFKEVLPFTDHVLFDLKHQNSDTHKELTGKANTGILANAKLVVESGADVLFRMPLIPGLNDSEENIRETAAFLKQLDKRAQRIELMPYHRMGEGKYQALAKPYSLQGTASAELAHVQGIARKFEELGIECSISS